MEKLIEQYLNIIRPKYLIKFFKTKEAFENWLRLGSKADLICTLRVFEEEEMYEECIIIKNIIEEYDTN